MASEKQRENEEKGGLDLQGPKGLEPYRATAQQNAIQAIRSAEERYAKAKGEGGEHVKAEESSGAEEAGDALGGSVTVETMHEARERVGSAVSGVAEKGRQAGEYVAEKAGAVKDSVKEMTRSATECVGQKATQVKEKIGEQTQAAQEKLKGMTIGGKEEGGEAAGETGEKGKEGETDARDARSFHTHWHSREHEQACKATKSREKDDQVVPCRGGHHHHENEGGKEEGRKEDEIADEGERSSGEGEGVGKMKLTSGEGSGGGGGILKAMEETVVGIMQTAMDMIVGRDSH